MIITIPTHSNLTKTHFFNIINRFIINHHRNTQNIHNINKKTQKSPLSKLPEVNSNHAALHTFNINHRLSDQYNHIIRNIQICCHNWKEYFSEYQSELVDETMYFKWAQYANDIKYYQPLFHKFTHLNKGYHSV